MALAILEFRDDTADSIMLPPYVVGRCGDRGSGHSSNINTPPSVPQITMLSCMRVAAPSQKERILTAYNLFP